MILNANQQGTLRNVYGQVDPFRNDLIHIFVLKAQLAILGYNSYLLWQKIYFTTCRPKGNKFLDPKEFSLYIVMTIRLYNTIYFYRQEQFISIIWKSLVIF